MRLFGCIVFHLRTKSRVVINESQTMYRVLYLTVKGREKVLVKKKDKIISLMFLIGWSNTLLR